MFKLATFSSLKHKDFRLFWFGSIVSEVGNQMQVVAINWQVYELTHSPLALGLVGLASFLPIPLFSLLGGIAADKSDRKKLLIYSQIFQGIVAVILTFMTFNRSITPLAIYFLVALSFVAKMFQAPAKQAIIPQLVPKKDFMNAISLSTLVRQASIVVGPAIAGFMIEYSGVGGVYLFNAISYIFLILAIVPIAIPHSPERSKIQYSFASVLEGIHFVRKSPILYSTMILDFFANFFASATVMLPVFAKDILKTGASGLGIMYAAPSVGAIIAGLLIASHKNIKNPGLIILAAVVLYGLATILFGLSNNFYLSLIFLSLIGAGDMISTVLRVTLRQVLTPDNLRGRMVAVNMVFIQGGPQLGELEAGALAAAIGAPMSVVVGGVGAVVSVILVGLIFPKLKNYNPS